MNIVMTGASGLIGTALSQALAQAGHTVFAMQRGENINAPFAWQPERGVIHWDKNRDIDAVIHLAGANIADGRWSKVRKRLILESRKHGTELLAQTLAQLPKPPKHFLSGSAIGFYGDTGVQQVDEQSPLGTGFLAEVCKPWETGAQAAVDAGIRTVFLRTGVVLSSQGGALAKMLLPFKLGLGGRVGDGKQYMSWVSLPEIVQMLQFILNHEEIKGAVNLVSKPALSNQAFTNTLGKVLKRPTVLPLPAFMVRLIFAEMGEYLLLGSSRVYPQVLEEAGYPFMDNSLEMALRRVLI